MVKRSLMHKQPEGFVLVQLMGKKSYRFNSKQQSKLYGNEEQCIICMENNINVFLPNCGHACICIKCCVKLNNKNKNTNSIEPIIYDKNEIENKFTNYPCYTIVYQGMGCNCIFRRLSINDDIEYLFIHSDDYNIDNKINIFIDGYAFIL